MITPEYLKCIECGGIMGKLAHQCPHQGCQTKAPRGILCRICGKRGKSSTIITIERNPFWHDEGMKHMYSWKEINHYHLECYNKVLQVDSCPACCQTFIQNEKKSCPHCGHYFKLNKCFYCHLPILEELSVFHKKQAFHRFCAPIHQKKEEERQELKRQSEEAHQDFKRRREEAEAENKNKQEALIQKRIITFVAILLLMLFISLVLISNKNSESIRNLGILLSGSFVVGIIPVLGEFCCALSFLTICLNIFGIIISSLLGTSSSSLQANFMGMFFITLSCGAVCTIRRSIFSSLASLNEL